MSDNKMILISNHLLYMENHVEFHPDSVIRINVAWVENTEQLRKFLDIPYDVMIDYPEGRTKPPKPTMTYIQTLNIVKTFLNVKYVAVSNIESGNVAALYKNSIWDISFVPKIETARGADNIVDIIEQSQSEYVMIDTEDLFLDVKGNVTEYELKYNYITSQCGFKGVKILKIQGVIFGEA